MMTKELKIRTFETLYTEARFAALFNAWDRLHDVVSAGKLPQVTDLPAEQVVEWLKEIAYTINETINELETPSRIGWGDIPVADKLTGEEEGGSNAWTNS